MTKGPATAEIAQREHLRAPRKWAYSVGTARGRRGGCGDSPERGRSELPSEGRARDNLGLDVWISSDVYREAWGGP